MDCNSVILPYLNLFLYVEVEAKVGVRSMILVEIRVVLSSDALYVRLGSATNVTMPYSDEPTRHA